MTIPAALPSKLPALLARTRFYYGWVIMVLAAAAMVGTLPGRTQGLGLGLFIVRLVAEFHGGRVDAENLAGRPGVRFGIEVPLG